MLITNLNSSCDVFTADSALVSLLLSSSMFTSVTGAALLVVDAAGIGDLLLSLHWELLVNTDDNCTCGVAESSLPGSCTGITDRKNVVFDWLLLGLSCEVVSEGSSTRIGSMASTKLQEKRINTKKLKHFIVTNSQHFNPN